MRSTALLYLRGLSQTAVQEAGASAGFFAFFRLA
jgi:hypothetical protein